MHERENLQAAADAWRRRKAGEMPAGTWDKWGWWAPVRDEHAPCCDWVCPNDKHPHANLHHCRTVAHVAALYGVDPEALRRQLNYPTERAHEGGDHYYKAVAVLPGDDGQEHYFSIFDGRTEYRLGEEKTERARQYHGGGLYCYVSPALAKRASVPNKSKLREAPRAILRCRAEGRYCRYRRGKLAFSRLTPLEVMAYSDGFSLWGGRQWRNPDDAPTQVEHWIDAAGRRHDSPILGY